MNKLKVSIKIGAIILCEGVKCITLKHISNSWGKHPAHRYLRLDNGKTFTELDSKMLRYNLY